MQNIQPPSSRLSPKSGLRGSNSSVVTAVQASWLQRRAKPSVTPSYNYVMGEESEEIFETLHLGTVTVGEGEAAREVPERDTDFETLVSKFDS